MSLDFSFFIPGENPFLSDLGLRPGLDGSALGPLLVIICMLLGYAAYTDFFRGWIIPNWTNGMLAIIAITAAPLVYADPGKHFTQALIVAVIVYLMGLVFFAMGDTKLYVALSLALGAGTVSLILFSMILFFTYGWYYFVRKHTARRRARAAGSEEKWTATQAPFGPAIAMAFPVSLYFAGLSAAHTGQLLLVEALVLLLCWLEARMRPDAGWLTAMEDRAAREEREIALGTRQHSWLRHGPRDTAREERVRAELAAEKEVESGEGTGEAVPEEK